MGVERRSMIIRRRREADDRLPRAGHALVADFLPGAGPLHKVTIIPRGRALGLTMQLPMDDKYNYSRDYLINRITILMAAGPPGDRCCSSRRPAPATDLEKATRDGAQDGVRVGHVRQAGAAHLRQNEEHIFPAGGRAREGYSEETALAIDVENQAHRARMRDARPADPRGDIEKLHALARALLERESLGLRGDRAPSCAARPFLRSSGAGLREMGGRKRPASLLNVGGHENGPHTPPPLSFVARRGLVFETVTVCAVTLLPRSRVHADGVVAERCSAMPR